MPAFKPTPGANNRGTRTFLTCERSSRRCSRRSALPISLVLIL